MTAKGRFQAVRQGWKAETEEIQEDESSEVGLTVSAP